MAVKARDVPGYDRSEPHRQLSDLDPYEHLARFYILCTVHYKRGILKLKDQVSPDVLQAMHSLSSIQPHPDFDGAIRKIKAAGKKAQGESLHDLHNIED